MNDERSLVSMLSELEKNGKYPMHMPGHKRDPQLSQESFLPYAMDITEIEGFDNLHDMHGVIKNIAEKAARLYGVHTAFPLVNGSTCGILAAVRALTVRGDRVIVARNCHRSVYHAIELCGLIPHYIYPKTDPLTGIAMSVTPDEVEKAFKNCPDAAAIILTSPTYEGVISDLGSISEIARRHSARTILDAAHGAHCGLFSTDFFPECGVKYADVAIVSLHKTMPSLTQTALLLSNDGSLRERLARELSVFETSSPSYILLASIEKCIDMTLSEGERLFEKWMSRLDSFLEKCKEINGFTLFEPEGAFALDRSKMTVVCRSGVRMAEHIRECGVEPEMASARYLLLMTGMLDRDEGFEIVLEALKNAELDLLTLPQNAARAPETPKNKRILEIYEAFHREGKKIPLAEAEGKMSIDYIMAYPPGIPLVVPGEMISRELAEHIMKLREDGVNVNGDTVSVADSD